MYAATKPGGKIGAKALIDTAVYRAGDALGAWAYGLFAMLPGAFGTAILIVPLTVVWAALGVGLGRSGTPKPPTIEDL